MLGTWTNPSEIIRDPCSAFYALSNDITFMVSPRKKRFFRGSWNEELDKELFCTKLINVETCIYTCHSFYKKELEKLRHLNNIEIFT